MTEEQDDETFSLESFQQSEKENKLEQSQLLTLIEKEPPEIRKPNEVDHYYQQLSLSFYSSQMVFDKSAPRSLNDQILLIDRQKAKTASSKVIYQHPTLSNGASDSTAVESQHQFNFHSSSNENLIRKEQKQSLKITNKQDEITFFVPELEEKILVLKQPRELIARDKKVFQQELTNKASGSTSFYQAYKKKQQKPVQQPIKNQKQEQTEKLVPSNYFPQRIKTQQTTEKIKAMSQVSKNINLSVLKSLIEKSKKSQAPSSQNSFYFTTRSKASPESPSSSAASNLSGKSGSENTSSRLLSLLKSPYLSTSKKKASPKYNASKKIQTKQQNVQQQYLEKQFEQIRKFQAIQMIKNNICKADYGLEAQLTPRDYPKQTNNQNQIQSILDKQLKKLLRKPK